MSYASATLRKRTMLDNELRAVLKVSGQHRAGFRDHVIISLAVGTALREGEIAALNLGDVSPDGRGLYRTIQLRVFKQSRHWTKALKEGNTALLERLREMQRVRLPDACYDKLERYVRLLPAPRLGITPLFVSGKGGRLSTRRIREMWLLWQQRAGVAPPYCFHELRHTAISIFRERTGDIRKAQLFARHANLETTTIYDHPRDQELLDAVRGQPG